MFQKKIKEWLKRYLPAEIAGTVTAVIAATVCHAYSNNHLFIAYIATIGEAVGFYLTVFIQYSWIAAKKRKFKNELFGWHDLYKTTQTILLEFGPATLLDDLLLRPFFMYLFSTQLKSFTLGILVGKIVGDIAFYMLVILSYEIKKYYSKNYES